MVFVVYSGDEFVDAAVFEFGVGVAEKFADVGRYAYYFIIAQNIAMLQIVSGEVYH